MSSSFFCFNYRVQLLGFSLCCWSIVYLFMTDPDLFLRKLKKRLYRPYRTWVQNAKVKLVHFIKVREEGNKSERF